MFFDHVYRGGLFHLGPFNTASPVAKDRFAHLLLFTLITGLSTTTPPLSSDLRGGLLHLAKFRTPIWEIEACHRPGKPWRVPKVAGGARGRYRTRLCR